MNQVIISGKITGDINCELDKNTTTTKFKLLNMVYSPNRSSMVKTIVRCITYGALAEYVNNELYEGCNVICTGRIQYRRYISNNQPIDLMYVMCNTVSILEQEGIFIMEINDDVYRDLLGICLTAPDKIPYILTKVPVDNIPKGVYNTIYQTVSDLYNIGVSVDIVTVSNRLLNTGKLKDIGGRAFINNIALEAIHPRHTNETVEAVLNQNTFKKVSNMVDEFSHTLKESPDVNKVCMDYCSKISNLISGNSKDDSLETIADGIDDVVADMVASKEKGVIGLSTGFPSLDFYTGGLQKGKLYIVGARPSMGKSSFVMNVAEFVSQTSNVLFISLEMSRKEYAQRMLFSRANVDVNKINSGTITDDDITAVCNQKDYLDSLNLFIETKTPCRVSDIELAIINLQASRGSCDLVVVDYLQLLTPMGKNSKNREVEVAEMSRDLKSLAIKYQVPIIVLSQLSRGLESRENKRPMLSDLRESGAIEQDADVVTFLYRNEYYFPDDPASRGAAELLIRKNRGGQNNRDIDLCWQPSKVKFMEASNREV